MLEGRRIQEAIIISTYRQCLRFMFFLSYFWNTWNQGFFMSYNWQLRFVFLHSVRYFYHIILVLPQYVQLMATKGGQFLFLLRRSIFHVSFSCPPAGTIVHWAHGQEKLGDCCGLQHLCPLQSWCSYIFFRLEVEGGRRSGKNKPPKSYVSNNYNGCEEKTIYQFNAMKV